MKNAFLTIIMAIASCCSYAQYLPLTAGGSTPLTGDLYIDGTNGNRLIFSYGGASNNKVLLGSTYSIFGGGSKDDFATYIRGSNPYSIWTNNLQRLVIDGSGNVGLGTSSPSAKLSLMGATTLVPFNSQIGSSGIWQFGQNVGVGSDDDTFGFYSSTFGPGHSYAPILQMNSANGSVLLAPNSGNVGIGTTSPGDLLQVNSGSVMRFQVAATKGIWVNNEVNGGTPDSPGDLYLNYSSSHNTLFNTNGGNVGIGTVSLDALLTIGSTANRGTLNVVGSAADVPAISITDSRTGGHRYTLYDGASSPGSFDVFDQTTGLYRFQINSNGNVAIGTTDPKGYKLAVAGNAIAESMTVKLQGNWPDYVFKKDYNLMPLSEIKIYIDKNRHLPEIPAAAEVEKNGQDLGEMNKVLVKKVEELTLYLIKKDKEIENQQKELNVQKSTNQTLLENMKKLEQRLEILEKKANEKSN